MKKGIVSILLAAILSLIPYLSALAEGNETGKITITMTGLTEVSIELSQTSWGPPFKDESGNSVEFVSPNKAYFTDPEETWCTLNNTGNCDVNTFILGENAVCMDKPTYKWILSSDGTIGDRTYGLWFRIFEDSRGYVPITKTQSEFCPPLGVTGEEITVGNSKQFGLKLLTPEPDFYDNKGVGYFSVGNATMKTTITISAVAA